jgi:hypothetical protein
MEFRKSGWLRGMLDRAQATRAAIVALDIKPTARNMREPVSGRLVRGMPAPTTWLLLLDLPQVADLRESFAFRSIETDAVPEGCIVYDTGATLLERIQKSGRTAVAMPRGYGAGVKHYGSMTWMPLAGEAGRRKRRNLAVIDRRLRAVRAVDNSRQPVRQAIARASLNPVLEDGFELAARARWKAAASLRRHRDQQVFVQDFNFQAANALDGEGAIPSR